MARPIDPEPRPRVPPLGWTHRSIPHDFAVGLPEPASLPRIDFSTVLDLRRSQNGDSLDVNKLSTLLFHATRQRDAGLGRFERTWKSRPSPSAGGLHVLQLLAIPVGFGITGVHDVEKHRLLAYNDDKSVKHLNALSLEKLTGAKSGTTLQFFADQQELESCYENSSSLLWRDSGALSTVISLVATALGLTSVTLGRAGTEFLSALRIGEPFIGCGAIHIGSK